MYEFPDLPALTQSLRISRFEDEQVDVTMDASQLKELFESAEIFTAIPKWEATHIYQLKSNDIPVTNQLYFIVRDPRLHDDDFGYIMYKDEDLYEMVYYRVDAQHLRLILNELPL